MGLSARILQPVCRDIEVLLGASAETPDTDRQITSRANLRKLVSFNWKADLFSRAMCASPSKTAAGQ